MRVVPSDIVAYIDLLFPKASEFQAARQPLDFPAHAQHAGEFMTIVNLINEMDSQLLPYGDNFVKLQAAVSAIKAKLASWEGRDPRGVTDKIGKVQGFYLDPVLLIREVMESLPDQVIPETVAGLEFIKDDTYRINLRTDIASVDALLHAGQWKAAMVIAGSAMEALLLYTLTKYGEDKAKAAAKELEIKEANLLRWHLPDYVKVAHHLRIINDRCATQAELAQDCRNLIHPGREIRMKTNVSHPDAQSSVAGLAHIVKNLTEWWSQNKIG